MFKWFFLLLYFFSLHLMAQEEKPWQLKINNLPAKNAIPYQNRFQDSLAVHQELTKVLSQLRFKGYFYADIENAEWADKLLEINLAIGEPLKVLALKNGNVEAQVLSDIKFREKLYVNRNFDLAEINQLKEQLLIWYDNNGFPFAQVWLDDFSYQDKRLSAAIFAHTGEKILIDTIRITGSGKVNNSFFHSYLGIKPKQPYQEQRIQAVDQRIKDLPFLTQPRKSEVEFVGNKARINLFLDKENANQFDGLIGFLPNQTTGKLQLTGDFRLRLLNALKQGETLAFNYKGLPQQTQELDLNFSYPYLFRSQLGAKLDFSLFKQDTSFLNLNTKIALVYHYSANRSLGFFIDNQSSSLIAETNAGLLGNLNTQFYGIDGTLQRLDNAVIPLKGYRFLLSAGAGARKIREVTQNEESQQNKISQFKFSADLNYYLQLSRTSVIYLRNISSIITGSGLYENEVFRIGGLKTLRGFDEQQFRAQSFTVQTVEYRYFVEERSYLNIFYNQAAIKQILNKETQLNYPLGFGAGFTFETKIGMLSLNYALGKQKNIPLDLQKGKVHFGVVSYF